MELLFALQNQTECLDGDYYLCSSHFRYICYVNFKILPILWLTD